MRKRANPMMNVTSVPDAPVEGVMEAYSDVTDFVTKLEKTQWRIVGGVFGSLSLLYLLSFTIVRRADNLIRAQSERMHLTHEAMVFHQANYDALTGLPNRSNFSERVDGMKLSLASGKLTGAEALIRWNDPRTGLVPGEIFEARFLALPPAR